MFTQQRRQIPITEISQAIVKKENTSAVLALLQKMVAHFSGLLELYAGILTIKNERSVEKDLLIPSVQTLHMLEEAHGMIAFKSSEE